MRIPHVIPHSVGSRILVLAQTALWNIDPMACHYVAI
jgi:hypothetical protein